MMSVKTPGNRLTMPDANKHFLDDIEIHQDYAKYRGLENNRIDEGLMS